MSGNNFALFGHIIHAPTKNKIEIFENSYLVCENGCVSGIFSELPEKYSGIKVVNYQDRIIIPGLVDLHIHAPQYTFRGLGMDCELLEWLNTQAFPEEARYADEEYAQKAYSIFADDMKKGATTRACIFATRHRNATIILSDLMEKTGIISYVGKVNMDRAAPEFLCEKGAEESAFDTFGWINAIDGKYKRTKPILTPRFIPCCSDKLLEELREIRRAYNLPVQSHLSENPDEIEWVKSLRPDAEFYGDAYDIYDLFGEHNLFSEGEKTIMAHCVWSTEKEIERIRKNGVFVAHCPSSNMNLASGIAPVRKYLELGIKVGLGTDVAAGQTSSVLRAMTDAVQASKLYWRYIDKDFKPLTFNEVFYLATCGGGEFFGKVGCFNNGYEFDAVVFDDSQLKHPREFTVRERFEQMVYQLSDCDNIVAKYVAGEKIV